MGAGRHESDQGPRRRQTAADVWRLIDRFAGQLAIDPHPHTLRDLFTWAEAHRRDEWERTSSLCALLATIHRDPKKHRRAFKPDDFNPVKEYRPKPKPPKVGIEALKVFVKK